MRTLSHLKSLSWLLLPSVVIGLVTARPVAAQDGAIGTVGLPGSMNVSIGTLGPLERDNTVASARFEQGVTAWRRGPLFVIGFVDATLRTDTRGYAWNNTLPFGAGGKVVLAGSAGVLQGVVGIAGDARRSARSALVPTAYVNYWAGWSRAGGGVQFPGNVWASSGVTAASEPDNWITAAHAEQGVRVWGGAGLALVPFVGGTAAADVDGRSWNNRGFVDAGVKVSTRWRGAAIDVGVAQRTTRAWQTRHTASAPAVFANIWVGWMPRVAPKSIASF